MGNKISKDRFFRKDGIVYDKDKILIHNHVAKCDDQYNQIF